MGREGFRMEQVNLGREALELLRLYDYDVIMCDARLSDMASGEFLRQVRMSGTSVPVLMLLDDSSRNLKVLLLDQGADDVVVTPCEPDEVFARLRAIVRRSVGHASSVLRMGPVELCLRRREMSVHGRVMPLSGLEYSLTEMLFLKQGSIVTRAAILHHLHGADGEADAKAVDVLVCRLRKKLAKAGVGELIETRVGGYILCDTARAPTRQPAAARSGEFGLGLGQEPAFA